MHDRVLKVIYDVLTQLSAETASGGEPPTLSPDTVLFGKNSRIDSLGLVNLIVMAEEKLEEAFGVTLTLADEHAMSMARSPFRDVRSFAEHIEQLLKETTG